MSGVAGSGWNKPVENGHLGEQQGKVCARRAGTDRAEEVTLLACVCAPPQLLSGVDLGLKLALLCDPHVPALPDTPPDPTHSLFSLLALSAFSRLSQLSQISPRQVPCSHGVPPSPV